MAVASACNFSGSVVRIPSGGERLPKVRYRRMLRSMYLYCQCPAVCGASMHSGYEGPVAGSYKRRRTGRSALAQFEVSFQSVFQDNFQHTTAVRGLMDGAS